jgi:hypothetical protein
MRPQPPITAWDHGLVPGPVTDQRFLRLASRRSYGALIKAGMNIREYQPGMTHVKSLEVDGLWAAIGTTNFDNRSFEHNDEVNVAVRDEKVTARIASDLANDLTQSREVTLSDWERRPVWEKLIGASRGFSSGNSNDDRRNSPNSQSVFSGFSGFCIDRCLTRLLVDGRGPDRDLLLGHRIYFDAAIAIFGLLDIVEVLLARKQRSITDVVVGIGPADAQSPEKWSASPQAPP